MDAKYSNGREGVDIDRFRWMRTRKDGRKVSQWTQMCEDGPNEAPKDVKQRGAEAERLNPTP
jgi:hypothetical protein